ncbi:MAG: hypothetical protein RMJ54_00490 [Roseiflexaceae bacterium]|nr:hypothetical protein [Roseiflexaceae bacterium]
MATLHPHKTEGDGKLTGDQQAGLGARSERGFGRLRPGGLPVVL